MIIHLDRSIDQRCLFDAVLYSSFSSCWKGAPIVHFDFCLSVHVKPSLKLDHVMIWWVGPPYESIIWWWWLLDSTAVQWLTGGAILWHNHVLWAAAATVGNRYRTNKNTKIPSQSYFGQKTDRGYCQHVYEDRKNLKRVVMSSICSQTHPLPGGTQNLGQAK